MASQSKSCVLIAMKGHPGTGKSTLARAIAASLRLPLLDKDDVRDATFNIQTAITDPTTSATLCNDLSYAVLWRVSRTQLHLHLGTVVDSPLSRRTHFDRLAEVAAETGARMLVVECRPGNEAEWRRRLEERGREEGAAGGFRHKPRTWEELEKLMEGYGGCWEYENEVGGYPVAKLVVDSTAEGNWVDHAVAKVQQWVDSGGISRA